MVHALCSESDWRQPMASIGLLQCRLIYVATANEVELWSCRLLDPAIEVIGWDIEWKVTFKSGERHSTRCFLLSWRLLSSGNNVSACNCSIKRVQPRSIFHLRGRCDPHWLIVSKWQPPGGSESCQTRIDPRGPCLANRSIANVCSLHNGFF